MTDHSWIPCKIKSRVFTSCFNRPNDGPKFDYWGRKKPYFTSVSMVRWYGYRVYGGF